MGQMLYGKQQTSAEWRAVRASDTVLLWTWREHSDSLIVAIQQQACSVAQGLEC
jgi:hypothetical protein